MISPPFVHQKNLFFSLCPQPQLRWEDPFDKYILFFNRYIFKEMNLEWLYICLFIHLLIQPLFISSLRCAGICPGHWGAMEKVAALSRFQAARGIHQSHKYIAAEGCIFSSYF